MTKRNLLSLVLILSVALNLVFVGGIGYRQSKSLGGSAGRPFPPNIGWIVRDLSEERQQELVEFLPRRSNEIDPIRREMITAQRAVNTQMAAADFDAQALSAAFNELRDASMAYQALSHEQSVALLSQLTEEERKMATEFVNRRGPREGRERYAGREGGPDGGRRPGGFPPPTDGAPTPPPPEPNR